MEPKDGYDWDAHLPKIIELYEEGLSIPMIHKAIQNEAEGFTPKYLSMFIVYRYPPSPDKRARFNFVRRLRDTSFGNPYPDVPGCKSYPQDLHFGDHLARRSPVANPSVDVGNVGNVTKEAGSSRNENTDRSLENWVDSTLNPLQYISLYPDGKPPVPTSPTQPRGHESIADRLKASMSGENDNSKVAHSDDEYSSAFVQSKGTIRVPSILQDAPLPQDISSRIYPHIYRNRADVESTSSGQTSYIVLDSNSSVRHSGPGSDYTSASEYGEMIDEASVDQDSVESYTLERSGDGIQINPSQTRSLSKISEEDLSAIGCGSGIPPSTPKTDQHQKRKVHQARNSTERGFHKVLEEIAERRNIPKKENENEERLRKLIIEREEQREKKASKYSWNASTDSQEQKSSFQTSMFKTSYYDTAHNDNPHFQLEAWRPDVAPGTRSRIASLRTVLDKGVDSTGKYGTALQAAAYEDSDKIDQHLLDAGAVPLLGDVDYSTISITFLSKHRSLIGRAEEVIKKIESEFNVSLYITGLREREFKITGLHADVEKAKETILKLVEDEGIENVLVSLVTHYTKAHNGQVTENEHGNEEEEEEDKDEGNISLGEQQASKGEEIQSQRPFSFNNREQSWNSNAFITKVIPFDDCQSCAGTGLNRIVDVRRAGEPRNRSTTNPKKQNLKCPICDGNGRVPIHDAQDFHPRFNDNYKKLQGDGFPIEPAELDDHLGAGAPFDRNVNIDLGVMFDRAEQEYQQIRSEDNPIEYTVPFSMEQVMDHGYDSDVSDSRSVASIADSIFSSLSMITGSSMSSVAIALEATDRLVRLLLEDSIINTLCREAITVISRQRFERNLMRLLKGFAVELKKEAFTEHEKKVVHFVRFRARNSAHMLCNTLDDESSSKSPRVDEPSSAAKEIEEIVIDDSDEEVDTLEDSESDTSEEVVDNLQPLEVFIKTSQAFEILRTNLRAFIHPFKPQISQTKEIVAKDEDVVKEISQIEVHPEPIMETHKESLSASQTTSTTLVKSRVNLWKQKIFEISTSIMNLSIWRRQPPIPDGKGRIEWKCKCGHHLYDDFIELKPGGLERLKQSLDNSSDSSTLGKTSSFDTISRTLFSGLQTLRRLLSEKNVETGLPIHESQNCPDPQLSTNNPSPEASTPESQDLLYLLLCYNSGRFATRLLQIDLSALGPTSDQALFKNLRREYKSMRGFWTSYLSLRSLQSIKFVHFELFKSSLVDVRQKDVIPPPEHVEYRYLPAPPEVIPPIGTNHLMHLFQHPEHADEGAVCLDRFPKKLKERLECRKGQATNFGWGLQFVEGWNMKIIWVLAWVFFGTGSLMVGVLWAIYGHNVQNAFAIAAYIVAFATISFSIPNLLSYSHDHFIMESRPNNLRVLIVGGGSAGLLIAQILQKVNIASTVFEQDATPFARPRDWNFGIYWAQSRLDECLSDEKRAKLLTVQTDPSYKPSSSSILPVYNGQTGELMKELPAPWSLRIHRRKWLKMLSTDIDIQFGKRLESIERSEESVTITFTDGTKATGNLLIGADGAHSVVREYLFGVEEAASIPSPVVASATICKISREASLKLRALHPRYIITFHPNGVFTWMSIHDCSSENPEDWTWMMLQTWRSDEDSGLGGKDKEEMKLETWYKKGRDFGPPFDEAFASMDPKSTIWHNRLGYWPTKSWNGRGQITLAGDAAHPMTFHRGQGLNNAITDAADLLQHLRNMKEPTPFELAAAVKRYEAELVPRGNEAVLASNDNTNAVHNWVTMMDSPLFRAGPAREGDQIEVPSEKKEMDSAADFFDNLGITYEKAFAHDAGLLAFVISSLELLPQGASVLDIGCGTGKPISSMVVASGRTVHGIDISPVMIELSRKQVPGATFELTNMLEFRPKTQFDAAFAVFSLFSFSREEMSTLAEKWSQWIAPNGYLFIGTMVADDFHTEPQMSDEDGLCAWGIKQTFMGTPLENLLYSKEGWRVMLQKVGFEVIKTEMVPFQPPPEAKCDLEPHYYITASPLQTCPYTVHTFQGVDP
ncbi:hypothetical protein B7494_g4654 [Chlorociboria aeruginascens]|nr:hypothetical protein B7494_g4654 [Chlorociboria aeruginascens]